LIYLLIGWLVEGLCFGWPLGCNLCAVIHCLPNYVAVLTTGPWSV